MQKLNYEFFFEKKYFYNYKFLNVTMRMHEITNQLS